MAEKGKDPDHPKKGVSILVHPIREIKDIKTIKTYLDGNTRNSLLFILGINTGIRITDILELKVGNLKYLKPGESHRIIERKTGKKNIIVINKSIRKALDNYISDKSPDDEDYLFSSRKKDSQGQHLPLHIGSITRLVKEWTKIINSKEDGKWVNYGARTLRKTWGYQQRMAHGIGFEIICKRFNHSSPSVTMAYLGIEDKEVVDALMNEI